MVRAEAVVLFIVGAVAAIAIFGWLAYAAVASIGWLIDRRRDHVRWEKARAVGRDIRNAAIWFGAHYVVQTALYNLGTQLCENAGFDPEKLLEAVDREVSERGAHAHEQ